ncbi:MAG: phosphate ABC transporter substrate-binding protein [Candidatus Delongbacteria bacterium]|nr:phosphate ABC transporter substrate-binding protein [Candidatus Delongbacteria bacterium]MBN2836969.1 phosphate ABC transporter substrate-binding protein [Candidatus Delongbacteria bacterium]
MKIVVLMLSLICAISLSAVEKGLSGELKIAGGTAHIEVYQTIAKMMMDENPDLKITISGGGSGVGIKQVGEGLVDIGNSGRDLKESEITQYGLVPHKIAIDGIAVIVNPASKITNLTMQQIQDIFLGRVKNWKEIGGDDQPINIYTRDANSGTRQTFEELALAKNKVIDEANFVNSNGNMKVNVGQDEYSIGYVSVGNLDDKVKAVSIDGIEPNIENVMSGAYKVQRFLYSVTKGEPTGLAKSILDEVLSAEGQKIVENKGFIRVK